MEKTEPSYLHYLVIWGWLIALLLAGTFISYLPLAKRDIALVILGVSLVKAVLVTLFYMHLKSEKWVPLWVVAVFPFFLIGLAVLLLLAGNALS